MTHWGTWIDYIICLAKNHSSVEFFRIEKKYNRILYLLDLNFKIICSYFWNGIAMSESNNLTIEEQVNVFIDTYEFTDALEKEKLNVSNKKIPI